MPKMTVKESILIAASPRKISHALIQFKDWKHWSPWLIAEPQANVIVAPDQQSYRWEGDIVGVGEMAIKEVGEAHIYMDLTFLKPFKSKAKVAFQLLAEGEQTRLTWTMNSRLPFFLFWIKKSIETFVAMDYCRGLLMLKDWIELGTVPSTITVAGIKERSAQKYVGIVRKCSTADIEKYMEKDFEKLITFAHKNLAQQLDGPPFTIYPVWDVVRKKVHYCACQPLTEYPEALPADFCQGQLEASKVHGVEHKGPYRHVANAWAVQMMYKQKKIFRANKKLAPIEIYHNSPTNTPERELISEIQFAVK